METQFSRWVLLLPALMSAGYGLTVSRVVGRMGRGRSGSLPGWLFIAVPSAILTVAWSAADIPLPLFYLVIYAVIGSYFFRGAPGGGKKRFLTNLSFLSTVGFHMVIIGVMALVNGTSLRLFLLDSGWRALSISTALFANILLDLFLRGRRLPLDILNAEADRRELQPFTIFLWFCTASLLLDSALCMAKLGPTYTPVFLIGSNLLLLFFLARFLQHIYAILRSNYLEDEHGRLRTEIEQRDQSANQLRDLAYADPLTGAHSRRYAMSRIGLLMEAGRAFSLVFIDLDRLKAVNDREGHGAGDRYLSQFASVFSELLRKDDIFARVGGDEFLVLMPDCSGENARRRMESIRERMEKDGRWEHDSSFSFGITYLPEGEEQDPEDLVRSADRAMYRDKGRLES